MSTSVDRTQIATLLAICLLLGKGAGIDNLEAGTREWRQEAGHRWSELSISGSIKGGFSLLGSATGLAFTNSLDEVAGAANRVLYNGSGLAAGDADGDGLTDLFFCNLSGQNGLFKNLGGGRFADVTDSFGLGGVLPATRGAVFADINGDGKLDLLVSVTGRGVVSYVNDGKGGFLDATSTSGTASRYGSTTLALADVDGNGTLDLYVTNYRPDDIRDRGRVRMSMIGGRPVLPGAETNRFTFVNGRLEECGQADQLFLNDGQGRFRQVPWTGGVFLDEMGQPLKEAPLDWGLTATFRDINGDQAPDLYVCNDYWTPDRLWINDGKGHFRAIQRQGLRKISASSMSVDFSDIDRDGDLDFFVVDMVSRNPAMRKRQMYAQRLDPTPVGSVDHRPQVVRNTLFLNRGDLTFAEVADAAGVAASDWSWAPIFLDVDFDGFEDLLIGAGHFRDVQDYDAERQVQARQHSWEGFKSEAERQKAFTRELMEHYHLYPLLPMPIGAFRNRGDGSFVEVTDSWGLNHLGVHHGLALLDFDDDGDMDLAVNNLNRAAMLFRNETSAPRVAVRLAGNSPNTQGIGAQVILRGGAVPLQATEILAGGRYQSGSEAMACFAANRSGAPMALEVCWRSGLKSVVTNVLANRIYQIEEASGRPGEVAKAASPEPLFREVSDRLKHQHHEVAFDDFERQPLLPHKLSQLGPGLAWSDANGDGHDDLVIGAGSGGTLAVFLGDGRGGFQRELKHPTFTAPSDLSGIVPWHSPEGGQMILAGMTGYEAKTNAAAMSLRLQDGQIVMGGTIATELMGASAMALGAMDPDGRLSLFIGGGVSPGHYPLGGPSRLYTHDGVRWVMDTRSSAVLENLGIVNGAVFSDLSGDGLAELILACEWGPVRIFERRQGAIFEVTDVLGLTPLTGWWRGVTTGDLNGDGLMDIVASNWGFNTPYRASAERPLVFLYGQMAQPGMTEVIETEYLGSSLAPRRQLMALTATMPFLFERFQHHKGYSEATVETVLGDRMALARRATATTLASTVFLNTGIGFRAVAMPREAQWAPAFAVCVGDADGDGHEDVFLSQNFFDVNPEASPIDAGVGLWFRGDGKGGLTAITPAYSGIRAYGQQRGAALADFDADGRVDLALSQNGAATQLYQNVGAKAGLRVRLSGTMVNPTGVGAMLRLQSGGRLGPGREIHAGSGYWSSDSAVMVLTGEAVPESVWIRWPGGKVTTTPVPTGARELVVNAEGEIKQRR